MIMKRQNMMVVISKNGRSPSASCTRPRLTAVRSSASSGSEVPVATIFAPIRIGGTPKATAIFEAE